MAGVGGCPVGRGVCLRQPGAFGLTARYLGRGSSSSSSSSSSSPRPGVGLEPLGSLLVALVAAAVAAAAATAALGRPALSSSTLLFAAARQGTKTDFRHSHHHHEHDVVRCSVLGATRHEQCANSGGGFGLSARRAFISVQPRIFLGEEPLGSVSFREASALGLPGALGPSLWPRVAQRLAWSGLRLSIPRCGPAHRPVQGPLGPSWVGPSLARGPWAFFWRWAAWRLVWSGQGALDPPPRPCRPVLWGLWLRPWLGGSLGALTLVG